MKIFNKNIFKREIAIVIVLFFVFGCFFSGQQIVNGQSSLLDVIGEISPLGAERFVDNGDNSITDASSSLTWMKCDYGQYGTDCSKGMSSPQFVDYSSVDICYKTDSFINSCQNGVLCRDGNFVTVDWRMDYDLNPSEYPVVTKNNILTSSCPVKAPSTAKDRACEKHGGVSKYEWNVPTVQEIKTLYDNAKSPNNIDNNFFPTTHGEYITKDTVFQTGSNVVQQQEVYNFLTNDSQPTAVGAPLKCVSKNETPIVTSVKPPDLESTKCQGLPVILLRDAVSRKLVTFELWGTGEYTGKSINLKITNITNNYLKIKVPLGLILYSKDPEIQNMVVARDEIICLPPGNLTVLLYANCVNSHKGGPGSDTKFSIGPDAPAELIKVLRESNLNDEDEFQDMVWQVTDGLNIDPISNKIFGWLIGIVKMIKTIIIVFIILHAGSYLIYDKIILKNPNPILNRIYSFLKDITTGIVNSIKKLFNKSKT